MVFKIRRYLVSWGFNSPPGINRQARVGRVFQTHLTSPHELDWSSLKSPCDLSLTSIEDPCAGGST
jgi:hypothetical protein